MKQPAFLLLLCLYIPAAYPADAQKARAYPTIFSPRMEALKIRYFLREDGDVTVRIYTAIMDPVYEIKLSAGEPGAVAGSNTIRWDGRGGDDNVMGRTGAYHILIDKGYEKEWTGAVIKNY